MKKFLAIIVLLIMVVGYVYAEDWNFSSGEKTASSLIKTGPGNFHGIMISSFDKVWPLDLNIFDAITGAMTGKKIIPSTTIVSSELTSVHIIAMPVNPVRFNNGLFVSMVCSSGTYGYTVLYK